MEEGSNLYPRWSPDGNRIAFISNRDYLAADTLRYRQDLYIMDADGSNPERVTESGYVKLPVWNPDGEFITFRLSNPPSGLFQVELSSGEIHKIWEDSSPNLTGRMQLFPQAWSPDGTQLVITGRDLSVYPRRHSLWIYEIQHRYAKIYSTSASIGDIDLFGVDWFVTRED